MGQRQLLFSERGYVQSLATGGLCRLSLNCRGWQPGWQSSLGHRLTYRGCMIISYLIPRGMLLIGHLNPNNKDHSQILLRVLLQEPAKH